MEIRHKEALKLVGIKVETDWRHLATEMPAAWQVMRARQAEIENRVNNDFLDVCLQEKGEIYTQCVGVEVSHFDAVPEGMTAIEIPAQQYVYHLHTGSEDQIAATFGAMYAWALQNGIAVDEFKIDRISSTTQTGHHLFIRIVGRLP